MVICLGGVCVPLNLLLPFLIGLLHRYGFFKWFKAEWVTIRYWQNRWSDKDAEDIQQVNGSTGLGDAAEGPDDAAEASKAEVQPQQAVDEEPWKAR